MIKVTKNKSYYFIRSPYDPDLVIELKAMKGARWKPELNAWTAPICERNEYAIKYLLGYRCNFSSIPDSILTTRPLFKHQKEGVAFALSRKHCMLAFEMGLGKTLTCIEVMERSQLHGAETSMTWWLVAPFGAQQEWKRQLKRWDAKIIPSLITTYESLGKYMDVIEEPPQGVIFDESVKIKNPNAQRSQISAELSRIIRATYEQSFIILLSGAPAPKEPTDWWHQIECIFPGWLREGDVFKLRKRLANLVLKDHGYGKFYETESWKEDEVQKLGKRLSPLVLVKKKADCLDLPEKIFDVITVSAKGTDNETLRVAQALISQAATGAEALEKLRELSDGFQYIRNTSIQLPNNNDSNYTWIGSPKLDIIKELLDFYHTDNGGVGRLVIYTPFHATVDYLFKFIHEHGWTGDKIDGRGWSSDDILERFDSSSLAMMNYCIIANPACVHGLSFARTECLVYYSNGFSVDHRIQSMDRRDRPGMDTTKGTRIVDIINLNTDKLILERLQRGMEIQEITLQEIKRCLNT